ncbi:MAG TPA: hypothetical protein VGM68_10230, partial [Rhizomicrobium sp.]
PGLDPWGLPLSAATRRETEDMLARVSRSEAESSDSYRRIEDQLRSVSRRLDSAERSQSENNRAASKAASEINIANREQAQAFDQLGGHVMTLSERLERLEHNAHQDGLKDAVKGLHQGLSRLADQLGQTASQSAIQVSTLTGNLEQLAIRLGQARADAENATRALEARIASIESSLQFTAASLEHVQERVDVQANNRAHDLADLQKREAKHQGGLDRIEERIARLESKGPDPVMERRLDNIERALSGIVVRLEQSDPSAALADTLRQVNHRLDAVEKNHGEMLSELRANLAQTPQAAAPVAEAVMEAPPFKASAFEGSSAFDAPATDVSTFEAPAFPEPETSAFDAPSLGTSSFGAPNFETSPFETSAFDAPAFEPAATEAPPFTDDAQPHADAEPHDVLNFSPDAFSADPFAPEAAHPSFAEEAFATNFEMPQDLADALDQPIPGDDNFLSAARRSAKAASAAETHRSGLGFNWSPASTEGADKTSPRFVGILVTVFIALLIAAAVLLFNQRNASRVRQIAPAPARATGTITPRTVVPTPPVATTPSTPTAPAPATSEAKPAATPAPAETKAPISTAPAPAAPQANQAAPLSTDKIAAAANAGNPVAETVIGLKYLDGQGIPADPVQASKWLQKAADAGQAVAQYRLGTMYERGQGVTANPATAAKWYQASANLGNRKAMHNLAVAFAEGSTGKKDMAESARWFSKAAALGLSDSQFNLAVLYERGDGVPQSLIDAYKWYSIAAAAGDTESKTRIAVLSTQLPETDRTAAIRSAQAFKPAPLNRIANVPPEPSDIAVK